MKFNFKKLLGSLVLALMLASGNNCLNICSAMNTETVESEDTIVIKSAEAMKTIQTVFSEYKKILKLNLKYEPDDLGKNATLNIPVMFKEDCEHV